MSKSMSLFICLSMTFVGAVTASDAVDANENGQLIGRRLALGGSFFPDVSARTVPQHKQSRGSNFTIVARDDNSYESGYSLTPGADAEFVHRLDLPGDSGEIQTAGLCMLSTTGGTFNFEFVVYRVSGGQPGSPIATADVEITLNPGSTPFCEGYAFLPAISVNTDRIFAGVRFDPDDDLFVAVDEDGTSGGPGFFRQGNGSWNALGASGPETAFVDFRNLGVAVGWDGELSGGGGGGGDTSPCVDDGTTLCLNDDRFEVKVGFETPQGDIGVGQSVELTNDTGYFWFFDIDNVEMVVKVLDACAFADRFWVFSGGLTNVQVDFTVRDTQTGDEKTYSNPLNTPFQPIQDTGAFATCP